MNQNTLLQLLDTFSQAWNAHDVEQLMNCMHVNCRFETVAGDDVHGTGIVGADAVREVFSNTFKTFPDAQWRNAKHWISADGNYGVSESTFMATTADGGMIEANMVDIFHFKDGKILLKNAFRKNRPVKNMP
ncbi:nuclear transport factor 2 family protein [Acinetobacter rathckeae]|uniref:nuclear transport factor 2 family protein n=1 Tax=Acinetobacter rathckeae TaxID=2605272 RepID=UPI0018A33701|nr:nuclear transport factor 2 family protein [Acinetobacter rathckeae]MBF7688583.1 nuclear transport factor 2 family protein [Acinetobacter rathckeae]MBF7695830.1 nuclear transport factor 2 family protein [Acinetobacter rathckeae]